jgi:hypothetical protein
MPERRSEVAELVSRVRLLDVSFHELRAKRADGKVAESEPVPIRPVYEFAIETSSEGDSFRLRLRVTSASTVGLIVAEVGSEYESVDQHPVPPHGDPVLLEFANEVGIMVLLAYLRQAVADLTQRVFGTPLLMPVISPGDLVFSAEDVMDSPGDYR